MHRDPALSTDLVSLAPNEPIALYTGPLLLRQSARSLTLEARVTLQWLPSPRVVVEASSVPDDARIELGNADVQVGEQGPQAACQIAALSGQLFGESSLIGVIRDRVTVPRDCAVTQARFLVPNFEPPIGGPVAFPDGSFRAARIRLVGGGWNITLDETIDLRNNLKALKANSGYAVTQLGLLQRDDGAKFNSAEANSVLEAVSYYLSFACGRWTIPFLAQGLGEDGAARWTVWDSGRVMPYRFRHSWMDTRHRQHLEGPFSGFFARWSDESWRDVVRLAIHWYVEANSQAGSVEGAIVLTQTALELLASAALVENGTWLSQDGYSKLPAADHIRLLLTWANLPLAIPAELGDLAKAALANNCTDVAAALTWIRNSVAHPSPKNRQSLLRSSAIARGEAWVLGLWHLELCLLRLFGYSGTYGSRLTERWAGEVVSVPWATGDT